MDAEHWGALQQLVPQALRQDTTKSTLRAHT